MRSTAAGEHRPGEWGGRKPSPRRPRWLGYASSRDGNGEPINHQGNSNAPTDVTHRSDNARRAGRRADLPGSPVLVRQGSIPAWAETWTPGLGGEAGEPVAEGKTPRLLGDTTTRDPCVLGRTCSKVGDDSSSITKPCPSCPRSTRQGAAERRRPEGPTRRGREVCGSTVDRLGPESVAAVATVNASGDRLRLHAAGGFQLALGGPARHGRSSRLARDISFNLRTEDEADLRSGAGPFGPELSHPRPQRARPMRNRGSRADVRPERTRGPTPASGLAPDQGLVSLGAQPAPVGNAVGRQTASGVSTGRVP